MGDKKVMNCAFSMNQSLLFMRCLTRVTSYYSLGNHVFCLDNVAFTYTTGHVSYYSVESGLQKEVGIGDNVLIVAATTTDNQ